MNIKYDDSGNLIIEFIDEDGSKCYLKESKIDGCLVLGSETTKRKHLSQEMVEKLLPYFEHYVKHGYFSVY